ncbi:MAG: penicillin-binding protein 2 [Lachnospiraceae bacterium]|nr:penicillin-binding protein 2 [Lachnospiraceae bacterium]
MAKKRRKKSRAFNQDMKNRLLFAFVAFLAVFLLLIVNLILINVRFGKEYEQVVLAQQGSNSSPIAYRRGDILDSNGTTLATTKKIYNLILEPKNILEKDENKEVTIAALKKYFGFSDSDINEFLKNTESYYEIAKKDLEYEQVKPFKDYLETSEGSKVRGVLFEEKYERVYPNNNLACHLIGYTIGTNDGQGGIEGAYDRYLNGSNGREYTYINDDNSVTKSIETPVNGYNLVTSIDANIQSIVQEKVDAYMVSEGAANVSVLVMDPKTCNILALYNSHSYDPNDAYDIEAVRYQFKTDEEFEDFKKNATDEETVEALAKVWRNFVVSDVFEPGSTYKTFTIAGALEEAVVDENYKHVCDGGEQVDTYYIQCHIAGYGSVHGELTLSQALENSCNDVLMDVAKQEGAEIFDKYQKLFGFGQATNVDIPGEPTDADFESVIYHEDTLNVTELATSSFGQGVCVSMMQLGTAFCSVINGGYYYEPSVVQRIEDEKGNVIDNLENVLVRRTVSEEVSEIMKQQLFMVVEQGTGQKAAVEGYEIGGKTGTAEKLPRGNGKYMISFIGFAPVDDPQVVVYVVVDEPNTPDQSSSAASSYLFADIATELFPYMNIYKTNDNYDLDTSDTPDEVATPIYDGNAPSDDVAGGEENPYVSDSDEPTTETTEESEGEYTEGEYTEDEYSDEYSDEEYYDEYSEEEYYEEEY